MGWILLILIAVSGTSYVGLYYGVWGQALKEFSDESVANAMRFTSRLEDYDRARYGTPQDISVPRLAFLKDTERFSARQREIIHQILGRAHTRLIYLAGPLILLISWGTVFLSHQIAGPLYRFHRVLEELAAKDLRTRVHLRKHDEAKKLAQGFNKTVSELDRALGRMKKTLRQYSDPKQIRDVLSKELASFKTTED